MATAVSGSGAGFVFLLMEAFIDGAVHIGLSRDDGARAGRSDIRRLGARWPSSPASRRRSCAAMTTTPGGTTAEGLLVLEEAGLRAADHRSANRYLREIEGPGRLTTRICYSFDSSKSYVTS